MNLNKIVCLIYTVHQVLKPRKVRLERKVTHLGEIRHADRISVRQLKRKDDLLVDQMIILK
jgi:hypothetical protein